MAYRVGVIGCGRPWKTEGATGFGMCHPHTQAYQAHPDCEVVACADIREDNLTLFADQYNVPGRYLDAREMLEKESLDIVSICLWPHLHAEYTVAAAEAGVKAVHCEKPMATTWGDARRMYQACQERGVQLTFNHQRRFLEPFQTARQLLRDGVIGDLVRLEASCGDIYDWGTHWLDMLFFYNNETPVEWVIGQIDSRKERRIFGAPMENQAICHFKFANDVRGLLITGYEATIGASNRLIGTEGFIEVHDPAPHLRVRGKGDGALRPIETREGLHGGEAIQRGIFDLVDALKTGREPELSGRKALRATEVIFATWESSRWRGRIDLPLEIEDSPLQAMMDAGEIGPNRK